jgi:hypothetical protein
MKTKNEDEELENILEEVYEIAINPTIKCDAALKRIIELLEEIMEEESEPEDPDEDKRNVKENNYNRIKTKKCA